MSNLFQALGIYSRRLSACVSTKTFPRGPIKLRPSDTKFLQSRVPFIEALILNEFASAIPATLKSSTVSRAADIVEHHSLPLQNSVTGRECSVRAVAQTEGGSLRFFVSEKGLSTTPWIHLTESLMKLCDICDPTNIHLLHILLTEPSDKEVEIAFSKRGLNVEVPEKAHACGKEFLFCLFGLSEVTKKLISGISLLTELRQIMISKT
ncbi:hypothetical protein N8I77_003780 [Diaporthe amygdali]|uniref:Uncharacterized protein n=1 Tax=Phomopsis amygdali TaxID=1214568 RepID=A0AAD9SJM5_PHOAM|nr:hypothetical protein N8I77_003780 [Diaporthe amygdali]